MENRPLAVQTMRRLKRFDRSRVIVTVVLTVGNGLFALLTAATLDMFVRRPQQGGGSITTLLPGFVYACATVMKVCLASALVSAVAGLSWWLFVRDSSKPESAGLAVWGIASIAFTPSAPFVGTLAVLVNQSLVTAPVVMSPGYYSQVSRHAVFAMLAILMAGMAAAVISLVRRERPILVAILGLAANGILAGLFWYLKFYALGFDQDNWAPR